MAGDTERTLNVASLRKPRREVTRERICAAARKIFLTRGFGAATVEEIALAAGTRRSTLYNHFHDKNEILAAIAEDYLDSVTAVIERLPAPRPSRRQIGAWIQDFASFALQEIMSCKAIGTSPSRPRRDS